MNRRYTQAEVEEILRRSLRTADPENGVGHDDLVAAASEVGIEPALIEEAIRAVDRERTRDAFKERALVRKRRGFGRSVFAFLSVNGVLAALDYVTGPGMWVHYVALIWSLPLLFYFRHAFFPSEDELDSAIDKERKRDERRRRREEKERRRLAQRASQSELERAIENGVGLLVDAISHRVNNRSAVGGPRVRVPTNDGDPPEHEDAVTIERRKLSRRSR